MKQRGTKRNAVGREATKSSSLPSPRPEEKRATVRSGFRTPVESTGLRKPENRGPQPGRDSGALESRRPPISAARAAVSPSAGSRRVSRQPRSSAQLPAGSRPSRRSRPYPAAGRTAGKAAAEAATLQSSATSFSHPTLPRKKSKRHLEEFVPSQRHMFFDERVFLPCPGGAA